MRFWAIMKKIYIRFSFMIVLTFVGLLLAENLTAQYYSLTLNQRRRFDQIYVELWINKLDTNAPAIGSASLIVEYNIQYLTPSENQGLSFTDSIASDVNLVNPIININSRFNNTNGYRLLGSQSYGIGYYSMEINLASLGKGGINADSNGRGSFIGKLIFDIQNNPSDSTLTFIEWSKSQQNAKKVIFDADSNDITSKVNFADPGNFNVVGLTILSPNFSNQVVDRDKNYASLSGKYASGGYPIYFERSVNPTKYFAPHKTPLEVDDDLSYKFDYSLDNGNNWIELGRIAETEKTSNLVGDKLQFRSGEVFNPASFSAYTITTQMGNRITDTNYRKPLRVLWNKSPYFVDRSEEARLKISFLKGTNLDNLTAREVSNVSDISDAKFVLGRIFFLQLDGVSQYLKTESSFINSTQLTVEAWVNLNSINAVGSEPAIVASSLGPDATQINGSKEGSWMLYLKDGKYPAFRCREILSRGENGYIASLSDVTSLSAVSDSTPLSSEHSKNWMHIAATVNNNIVTLFVNGEIVDKYQNLNATDIRMLPTKHPVWVGINPNDNAGVGNYLHAGIKEVRVWQTALTQDEIRRRIAGIINPSQVDDIGDLKAGLELYYSFEGSLMDFADNEQYQGGNQKIDLFSSLSPYYRPDQPHIRLTAPVGNVGVSNKEGDEFEIRWVSYGLGDIENSGSNDIEIEYSIDGSNNWYFAKDADGNDLAGNNAPDVEDSKINWEAWENNNSNANLRTIFPYAHKLKLRIRGTQSREQNNLMDITEPFTVAQYFALHKTEGSVIELAGGKGMNITGNTAFIEAWIRPYRFPTESEGFMPIVAKYDSVNQIGHYAINLLPTGQIEFTVTDISGAQRIAKSDINAPLVRPNSIAIDTAWTHIGIYLFLNSGSGQTEVRFFVDGKVQRDAILIGQLGSDLKLNTTNQFPLYVGYLPSGGGTTSGFVGEIRELRFWNGTPNNTSPNGNEPTPMTLFIQGASSVRAKDLNLSNRDNLFASYSFNGTSFIVNNYARAIGSETNPSALLRFHGEPISYIAVKPYIKLVEPGFREKIANTIENKKVRWVGFDYNGTGFTAGKKDEPPSLEFSIKGKSFQYLGSKYWDYSRQVQSIVYPETDTFRFTGTGNDVYFASAVNFAKADPDINNDGIYNDQGPMAAALTNARLRLTGFYTINKETDTLRSEGPLFSLTPATNFTIRVLLEGYHNGALNGNQITNLASTYAGGGLKIKIYSSSAEILNALIDSSESSQGYDDRDPKNRNKGNYKFANVNFVFTDLTDGGYYVVVNQINHLPIMSRFAAPFEYIGDDISTWQIESGWDFTSWNGEDENALLNANDDPWDGDKYSAYGDSYSTITNPRYSTTGLIYNNGVAGGSKNSMAAMIGGDVVSDGQINASDRVRVRLDDGTSSIQSDVTGDGVVNADDRTITDRNFGKISSVYNIVFPGVDSSKVSIVNPLEYVSDLDKKLSERFISAAQKKISIRIRKIKKTNPQFGINYIVKAVPVLNKDTINLNFSIKNRGIDFGLANATFAIQYNSNMLDFYKLSGIDSVIFNDDSSKGYAPMRSAPNANAQNPLPNVRTIEIDYDAYANLPGAIVPRDSTYLGTLKFVLKNRNSVVKFDWHYSTSVHSVDKEVITKDGTFEDIPPLLLYSAQLNSPNGGEEFGTKRKVIINWNSNGSANVNIKLEYSSNAGVTWQLINNDVVNISQKTYEWTTPDIYSSNCLLRIDDAETDIELDRSDNLFSITPSSISLNRPASYDPVYKGGSLDSIKWTSKGYKYVRFEFSGDGGSKWTSISAKVNASSGKYLWRIPLLTTKEALIRMIDIDSDEEIIRSSTFNILAGILNFREPKENAKIKAGNTFKIIWNSTYIQKFDLQLSLDGGSSWSTLKNDVFANNSYFNWDIDKNLSSNMAILRALWQNDPTMIYGKSNVFNIVNPNFVHDNLPFGYSVSAVSPNPAKDKAVINIKSPKYSKIFISLYNIKGQEILNFSQNLNIGDNQIYIDLRKIINGTYYIELKINNRKVIRDIKVIK